MAKAVGVFLLILAITAGALYFWLYRPQQQAMETARQKLLTCEGETARLRGRVADLESIRDQLQRSGVELQQKVLEKEKELAGLRSTQDELMSELKQEIADKQVQVERIRDQLRVDMVDEVLFDSGEATLKPAGVQVLRKVGVVLAKTGNRRVEVQGHTDNVPITGALTKRFPTNWELSASRATNVVRFFQDEAKLDPTRLLAAAYSEYRPRASNDSDQGRRQNRRIEILLVPLPPPETKAP